MIQGGRGGNGGNGSAGGSGGGGGGGAGGSCYGIYSVQQLAGVGFITPPVAFNGVNTFAFGTPGGGGTGGLRGGSTTNRAPGGPAGTTVNFNPPTP